MNTVRITDDYMIPIPEEIRNIMHLKKGQDITLIPTEGGIEIVLDKEFNKLFGAFPNLTYDNLRDENDRF